MFGLRLRVQTTAVVFAAVFLLWSGSASALTDSDFTLYRDQGRSVLGGYRPAPDISPHWPRVRVSKTW